MYHVIEGIIGCGKSSVLQMLRSLVHARYYDEPYNLFSNFQSFNPMLEMSHNLTANAAISQLHIIRSACNYYPKRTDLIPNKERIISERSVLSANIFIEALNEMGIFSPFVHAYLKSELIDNCNENIMPQQVIFLNLNPVCALTRVQIRNRSAEKNCSLEYENLLLNLYLKYLSQCNHKVSIIEILSSHTVLEIAQFVKDAIKVAEDNSTFS